LVLGDQDVGCIGDSFYLCQPHAPTRIVSLGVCRRHLTSNLFWQNERRSRYPPLVVSLLAFRPDELRLSTDTDQDRRAGPRQ
jgi:hypothetical protein